MKLFVRLKLQCPFSYLPVYGKVAIDASNMSTKEQFAVEMIMTRYTFSSIYHLGSYSSFMTLIPMTKASYEQKFKDLSVFTSQLSVATSYLK